MRAPETPSTGLQRAPDWDSVHLQKFPAKTTFAWEPLWTPSIRGATKVAAESLKAQLHSQGKLTMPSRENRKIGHEIEILKANEHASYV
jgi:hypothetical protein